jgi:hypothetical protein
MLRLNVMKSIFVSVAVLLAGVRSVHAAESLDGIAAVVNNGRITFAEIHTITAEAEARASRELSGDALRSEIAKIRLKAIAARLEEKHAETRAGKVK